ncbi:phage tail protein [Pedobacter sp. PACM 27299]|uniref:siderophore-interacting protein n=1 Tax=Pedobacter sp. PACM 27299 TaxID=1727164 RepID=UPI000705F675|nr:siderophore-interacting protein [Pedobacter sp. PACM 27299]ALL05909.1 phage tail protein [Pedobacter sp. PACM 27299]
MSKIALQAIKAELKVTRKEYLSPHYLRIYLTGPDISLLGNTTVGVNNKILIPAPDVHKIHFPDFDFQKAEWIQPEESVRPSIRTYTHRGINLTANEIWIDFVVHGDEGPASAWAIRAKEGSVLGVLMHNGKSELYQQAAHYLLVGDATAIPVLGAILEDLPAAAKGVCIIEVHGPQDEQFLATKASIDFIWLHNPAPEKGSKLPEIIREQALPEHSRFGYVAAEFSSVKAIRAYLRKEKNWKQEELYAYSYWKAGAAEDKSSKERHQEKDSIPAHG